MVTEYTSETQMRDSRTAMRAAATFVQSHSSEAVTTTVKGMRTHCHTDAADAHPSTLLIAARTPIHWVDPGGPRRGLHAGEIHQAVGSPLPPLGAMN